LLRNGLQSLFAKPLLLPSLFPEGTEGGKKKALSLLPEGTERSNRSFGEKGKKGPLASGE
jgi:hypothetical protein